MSEQGPSRDEELSQRTDAESDQVGGVSSSTPETPADEPVPADPGAVGLEITSAGRDTVETLPTSDWGWASEARSTKQPEVPGAPGHHFAVTVTRVAALAVDGLVIGIVAGLIGGIIGGVAGIASPDTARSGPAELLAGLGGALLSYLYFTLMWRSSRKATLGQRLFRMQVGNAFDGATLTWRQATIRWLALFGLSLLLVVPIVATLGGLADFVWTIALFVTTVQSATKQGLHDRWANSAVVATGRQNTALAWGCLVVYVIGVALLAVLVGAIVGLIFLGSQVQAVLGGQVQFGTAQPTGCNIANAATEFPAGTGLYWVAYFKEAIPAGTPLVIELTKDGQSAGSQDYVTSATESCLTTSAATSPLDAGAYTLQILRGSTVEASGVVTLK